MNFYEHHLGDYAEATAHLTFVEDAAYGRLIRKYYATEQPIPADLKAAQRLVGARTREEREAVQSVLEEFFTLQTDGWHNERCDLELKRYLDKRSKARSSAEVRWNAVRPHSDGTADAMRPHSDGNAKASGTHNGRNALQSPVSSLHINPKSPVDNGDKSDASQKGARAPNGAGASKSPLPGGVALTPADLKRLRPEVQPGEPRFKAAPAEPSSTTTPGATHDHAD